MSAKKLKKVHNLKPFIFRPVASIFLLIIGALMIKRAEERTNAALYHHAGCVFPKVPRAAALEPRRPTLPAHTAVYEVIENRTAMSLFGEHMRKLAFRRLAQVESFCIKHKEWLRGEFATLFPLRAGDYWYFVDAYILDNGTVELNDADLDFPPMWAATNRPRVVVQVN